MATWWASVSRRCETLFGDLSKRKLQPIQNKDLEVDHEQSFLFEVKPGRRQGTCMCTYQATLSECNRYFHTPATTTPSQTPVYRMSLCYTGTRGKTPEHNQAKHTKHPHSLEWHNSTITIVFPSTLRNTLVVMTKHNATTPNQSTTQKLYGELSVNFEHPQFPHATRSVSTPLYTTSACMHRERRR